MKTCYLDIETTPADAAALEAMMPQEMVNPVMPGELENPTEPDWESKCPKYGGDAQKRDAWKAEAVQKWVRSTTEAREKWQSTALEARARFVENAALRAECGHVKMIGLSVNDERTVYLWEPDRKMCNIAEKEATNQKVALFSPFPLEALMFKRFCSDFIALMSAFEVENEKGETKAVVIPKENNTQRFRVDNYLAFRCVTYYGNIFDLPFLARRAAILGDPALMRFLRMHRRGRYLDSARFVDLHEEWTAGDRETKTGGLDGLCKILGVEGKTAPCGGSFYKFYAENPAEGVVYLLRDLSATQACAERMGV